jgi:hypothetical protein
LIRCAPGGAWPAATLLQPDIGRISAEKFDFILSFAQAPLARSLAGAARHGVWAFVHADAERYDTQLPAFWEIYKRDRVSGAGLRRLGNEPESDVMLKTAHFPTHGGSYAANLDAVCLQSADWPAIVCRTLQSGASLPGAAPPARRARHFGWPTNLQMLRFLAVVLTNRIAAWYGKSFIEDRWKIGIVQAPLHSFVGGGQSGGDRRVAWLQPRFAGKFVADPCAFVYKDKAFVFCEQLSDASRGQISYFELQAGERRPPVCQAIHEPFHMSYPYVFEHAGTIYCLPETRQAAELRLYAAVEFPARWEKVRTLISDFHGVDSTLLEHDGRWWLFCATHERGFSAALNIWHAPELLGPWQPHAANPVKIDVRSARPAGALFKHAGQLYRPAQDCSKTYGGRIALNRILKLDVREFAEETVRTVEPFGGGYNDGIHTVSALAAVTIVDGKRAQFKWSEALAMLRAALRKTLRWALPSGRRI